MRRDGKDEEIWIPWYGKYLVALVSRGDTERFYDRLSVLQRTIGLIGSYGFFIIAPIMIFIIVTRNDHYPFIIPGVLFVAGSLHLSIALSSQKKGFFIFSDGEFIRLSENGAELYRCNKIQGIHLLICNEKNLEKEEFVCFYFEVHEDNNINRRLSREHWKKRRAMKIINNITSLCNNHDIQINEKTPRFYITKIKEDMINENEINDAEKLFENHIIRKPVDPSIIKMKGLLERKIKHHRDAVHWLKIYLEMKPDDQVMKIALIRSLIEGEQFEEALSLAEEGMDQYPDNPVYVECFSLSLFKSGKHQDAFHFLDRKITSFHGFHQRASTEDKLHFQISIEGLLRTKINFFHELGKADEKEKTLLEVKRLKRTYLREQLKRSLGLCR